jgi:Tol biopolymer transport system component
LLEKVGPVGSDISVSLSPDGSRAAVASTTGSGFRSGAGEEAVNIWILDLVRSVRTRITFDPATSDENPTWSPDGTFLAFASHRNADRAAIYKITASGGRQDQPIYSDITRNPHPQCWSSDGKFLLVQVQGVLQTNISALPINSTETPSLVPYLDTQSNDTQGQFSPDGRWVAYTSDESGKFNVYVRPFPNGEAKWQISADGGSEPRWRGDGKELFYLTPTGTMMSVTVSAEGSNFHAAPPVPLFQTATTPIALGSWGNAPQYDVTKDGSKFLINTIVTPPTPPNLYVIANWQPPQ